MVEIITGWRAGVTGELFETEREAIQQDAKLLAKYNTKFVEEGLDESRKKLESFFKKALDATQEKGDKEGYNKFLDLYQAIFNRKLSRSNRYYGLNPFEVLFALETETGDFSNILMNAADAYNDLERANAAWKKDNQAEKK